MIAHSWIFRILSGALLIFASPLPLLGLLKVYVTNLNGEISVLDADSDTFVENFTPVYESISASGANLFGVAISPDGETAYVVDATNEGVWVINTADNSIATFISLTDGITATSPVQVAVTPDGSKIYISDTGASVIWVVNTSTYDVTHISGGAGAPYGVAISPDGTQLYVSENNSISSAVYVYNTSDDTPSTPATIASAKSHFIAISNLGEGYITNILDNTFTFFQTSDSLPQVVSAGDDLEGVAFTPDGQKAYMASAIDNTILSFVNGTLTTSISLSSSPWDVAFNPLNPSQAYATSGPGISVMVIEGDSEVSNASFTTNIPSAEYLAYVTPLLPAPPTALTGSVRVERIRCHSDVIHEITWQASLSGDLVEQYNIYRNDVLLASVPSSQTLYDDHERANLTDYYEVTTVNQFDTESVSMAITLP